MAQIPQLQPTNTLGTDDQAILRQGTIDKRISLELAGTLSWAKRNSFNHIGSHVQGLNFTSTEDFSTFQGKVYFVRGTVSLPYTSTTTDPTTDSNLYVKGEDSLKSEIYKPNHLRNHNFTEAAEGVIVDATPRDFAAGDPLRNGWVANEACTGVTYENGQLSLVTGSYYQDIPRTGTALEYLTEFTASVKTANGAPTETGVTWSIVGDSFRVVVTANTVFSVCFNEGDFAANHSDDTNQYLASMFNNYGYSYQGNWAPDLSIPAKVDRVNNYAIWDANSRKIIIPSRDDAFTTGNVIDFDNWDVDTAVSSRSLLMVSAYNKSIDNAAQNNITGSKITIDCDITGNYSVDNPLEGFKGAVITAESSDPALSLNRHIPDWDYYTIRDLTVDGGSNNSWCASFSLTDAFAGRWNFKNVFFRNGSRGVSKPKGNIGDSYEDCTYSNLDYGYRGVGDTGTPMHSGATTMVRSHMDTIHNACYYFKDAVDGGGAHVIKDSIFEQCDGFGVYLDYSGVAAPFVPPSASNLWMEAVAKEDAVNIDGVAVKPYEIQLNGVRPYILRDTYLKSAKLINSVLHAKNCRIDDAFQNPDFDIDNDSVLVCDDLYMNGQVGGKPFVNSISTQASTSGTKNLSVRGPLLVSQIPQNRMGADVVAGESFSGSGPWTFNGTSIVNATSAQDGVLNDSCAELVIPNNGQLFSISGTPDAGKWVVWNIHAKLMSGNDISFAKIGYNWVAGDIYLKKGKWVRSYGIQKVGSTSDTSALFFKNTSGGSATVRLADYSMVQFDNFSDAIEYCNSGISCKVN